MYSPLWLKRSELSHGTSVSARVNVGYAAATTTSARRAVRALSTFDAACASDGNCPSKGRPRSSAAFGIRVLDGGVFFGLGRRISDHDRWKGVLSAGFIR
jgi:hypothetical protein